MPARTTTPKDSPEIAEELRRIEVARHGAAFADAMKLQKLRKKALQSIAPPDPATKKILDQMRAEAQIFQQGWEKDAAIVGARIATWDEPRQRLPVNAGALLDALTPEPAPPMDFVRGTPNSFQTSAITATTQGLAGWINVPTLVNNDAGMGQAELQLHWRGVAAQSGTHRIRFTHPSPLINLHFALRGSGLWGLDAFLEVEIFSFAVVSNAMAPGFRQFILVNESKLMAGVDADFIAPTLPSVAPQAFAVSAGQTVDYHLRLIARHFADDGAVRLTVRTFGLPSIDADEELFLERIGS